MVVCRDVTSGLKHTQRGLSRSIDEYASSITVSFVVSTSGYLVAVGLRLMMIYFIYVLELGASFFGDLRTLLEYAVPENMGLACREGPRLS